MRYNNPLRFLLGIVLVLFFLACLTRSASAGHEADARARAALACAVHNKASPACGLAGCDCGCANGGSCGCASKPNTKLYRAIGMYWEHDKIIWVVSNKSYPTPFDSVHYRSKAEAELAAALLNQNRDKSADGWTYDHAAGIRWRWAPAATAAQPVYTQPALAQPQQFMPRFGGYGSFGGGGGGCAGGSCSGGG